MLKSETQGSSPIVTGISGFLPSFNTVVLEKTLESPLDCKEFQPVHSEGDQPLGFLWKEWC